MGKSLKLNQASEDIKEIAGQFGAANLRVFGSFAKGSATGESDLDLLVDFEPGRDLLDLIGLKQELERRLGIHVDIVTEGGLSPFLRDRILGEARPL